MSQKKDIPGTSSTENSTRTVQGLPPSPTGPLQAAGLRSSPKRRVSRRGVLLIAFVFVLVVGGSVWFFSILRLQSSSLLELQRPQSTVGQLIFGNSGQLDSLGTQGLNDVVTVKLGVIAPPASGNALYAWLRPDQGQDETPSILLGTLTVVAHQVQLTYSDPLHTDLLTTYSGFLVTEESARQPPMTPSLDTSTWRYQARIPAIPVPGDPNHYSLLSHLRHLLAKDPDVESAGLHGGLNLWLYRNSLTIVNEANTARDDWQSRNTADMHRQIVRILDYLDGFNYVQLDVPFVDPVTQVETPFLIDRKLGAIGLLTLSQRQALPGYLVHITLHLDGAISSPGISADQKALAGQIDVALTRVITPLFQKVHDDAARLVKMNDAQLQTSQALSLLSDMATNANAAISGPVDPTTGIVGKGVTWLHAIMQQLAVVTVMR